MKIYKLEASVIDQIAAGEVLERPANLIKELVENSLDAGATELDVQIGSGGREVVISDNGHGIAQEDLPLALERHATSKIAKPADLWELHSFGFRGEALASIAAVSRLKIISKSEAAASAFSIGAEFGKAGDILPSSRDSGTTVRVSDLFANVPARLKFLKSDSAEITQIKKVLKALALSHPAVTFRVKLGQDNLYYWLATKDWKVRVANVLDRTELSEASRVLPQGKIKVFFGSPNEVEKTSQNLWFFVNSRWIQDRMLQQAVLESYRNLLMHGEWPIAAIFLDVAPDTVDVNVHPAKSQVKFFDSQGIFRLVQHTLREELEKAPWLEKVLPPVFNVYPEPAQETNLSFVSDFGGELTQTPGSGARQAPHPGRWQDTQFKTKSFPASQTREFQEHPRSNVLDVQPKWSGLQVLGQVGLTYIVAQSSRGVMFIDQHAAHERVGFEKLMSDYKKKSPEVQPFLIPLSLDLDAAQIEALLTQQAALSHMGFSIERGGPSTLLITATPSIVKEAAVATVLDEMGRELVEQGASFSFEKHVSDIMATLACHSVVRAGQALSIEEMKSLLTSMDEYPLSSFCPHGRPVFVEYSFRDLESDFGRIV